MNFAIEVPGEAIPLNPHELCKALQLANSMDNSQRQMAGKQLTAWESYPDYFPALQSVFLDRSLPHETRFLSIILLKNGIDKFWRNASNKNALKPDAKHTIRSRLFQGTVGEEDKGFALHNALVIAKIVRVDYPQDWPDAITNITELLKAARSSNQAHLGGALLILLRVVKELSTARLRRSQTAIQAVAPELVQILAEVCSGSTSVWLAFLTRGQGDEDDADLAMQNSLLGLKILRRLLTSGYEYPHQDELVQQFWSVSQTQFGEFLGYVRHDSPIPAPYQHVVGKHLLQFTKLHIEMCESHPASFAVLPNSVPLVRSYWNLVANFADVFDKSGGIRPSVGDGAEGKSKMEGPLLERLALKGLVLLRNCITIIFKPQASFRYRSADVKKQQDEAIAVMKNQLLTNDFILQVVNVIITKLFIFRQSDLEAWESDPEEWESKEYQESDAWEWEVRPCAERLFLDLLTYYKDLLGQPLLIYFQNSTSADTDVVTKEAVYNAMGTAAAFIRDMFSFDAFLTATVVQDAQKQEPLAQLLRRRIAILLSQWVPVQIAPESRPVVFEIYRHLLNPNDEANDAVVRITAARQLKWVGDEIEFSPEAFMPYASDIFTYIVGVLQEVEIDETKLAILETLRVFVNRMEKHVVRFGDQIMSALPALWESAGADAFMVKQAVLAILTSFVMSMGVESKRYHQFILPVLAEAMNPSSEVHKFLLEEAIELWGSVTSQSPPPLSEELIALEEFALPLLEYESDLAETCLDIVKSYIILAPEAVLSDRFRRNTLAGLAKATESKTRETVDRAATAIQFIIRAAEQAGGAAGVSVVVQDLVDVGFVRLMMAGIHGAWEADQSTGPNRKKRALSTVTETDYLAILARVALADPGVFFAKLLSSVGEPGSVWTWLSAEWFGSFDAMADVEKQKLSCLALTRLCELPQPMQERALSKLQDYIAMWTSVVSEVQEGYAEGADTLIWDELGATEYDTPQDIREKELASKDPIHTVHTYTFVQARLQDLVRREGGEQPFESNWAVNVDKDVLAAFRQLSVPPDQRG